jgi:CheY-like chemotaxis protein
MTTILIVEDNVLTQRVLQLTLENQGYQIIVAGNGQEAIEQLERAKADLAVVDVAMPMMDGLSLLRHLRDDRRYEALPVIMLTANSQDSIRSQALAIGAVVLVAVYLLFNFPRLEVFRMLLPYVFPVAAVALGAIFLGERPGPHEFLGGALVIGGIALVNLRKQS